MGIDIIHFKRCLTSNKMRLNFKKILFFGLVFALLWVVFFYAAFVEVPRMVPVKRTVKDLEEKLESLRVKMDEQISESTDLLAKVKEQFKNSERFVKKEVQESEKKVLSDPSSLVIPVLVIACDRVTVRRCLDNLVKFRPSREVFPIIVSQDCGHNATYQVIKSFVDSDPTITVVTQPDLSEIPLPKAKVKFRGYYKIARHYKFALNYVFKTMGYESVIIVEDDLDISPDFFEYFLGTYPLLNKDPSLWCISAWNDNGKKEVIDLSRPELLYRTDFFPGLGWMLRKNMWMTLEPKWPPGFFDDWLRDPVNIDHKACIRPEISRTYSFGKVGVSKGLFFDKHLRNILLNLDFVEFTKLNLTYLLKENYDQEYSMLVYSLPQVSADEVLHHSGGDAARVSYSDAGSYSKNAKKLGLMNDFRSGVPRTAYRGIVTCYVRGRRIYLAPTDWRGYDPTWG